jgi:hypothetical protein
MAPRRPHVYTGGFLFVKKKALAFFPGQSYKSSSLTPGGPAHVTENARPVHP